MGASLVKRGTLPGRISPDLTREPCAFPAQSQRPGPQTGNRQICKSEGLGKAGGGPHKDLRTGRGCGPSPPEPPPRTVPRMWPPATCATSPRRVTLLTAKPRADRVELSVDSGITASCPAPCRACPPSATSVPFPADTAAALASICPSPQPSGPDPPSSLQPGRTVPKLTLLSSTRNL